jgi:tRNA-dihydrouridine synthase C
MLAPMEGVTDHPMREILTGLGGYSRCVTEFLRVTDHEYPKRVFTRICPELATGGVTRSGTPVYVQLLGSHAIALATNARKAVDLGAPGIDLNFGCPAKTVNRHGGGSALLRSPEVVEQIVCRVREAVPASVPVTAKMRLGFDNSEHLHDIAQRIERAGADELCIHARTRTDGYRPPAYWPQVFAVKQSLSIPVIINGEIWTTDDSGRARNESGCTDLMLGRGALARPLLGKQIALQAEHQELPQLPWSEVLVLLKVLLDGAVDLPAKYAGNRTKQWLTYLKLGYPAAGLLFDRIKRMRHVEEIGRALNTALDEAA